MLCNLLVVTNHHYFSRMTVSYFLWGLRFGPFQVSLMWPARKLPGSCLEFSHRALVLPAPHCALFRVHSWAPTLLPRPVPVTWVSNTILFLRAGGSSFGLVSLCRAGQAPSCFPQSHLPSWCFLKHL